MTWQYYSLDREAQKLVLDAKVRDRNSLNQSFKMREAVAYGLERFWGEHLRLQIKEPGKSQYWKETWDILVKLMEHAKVPLPNDPVDANQTDTVKAMAEKLWKLKIEDQRVALAVLAQLCDCLVWWTQRYKGVSEE